MIDESIIYILKSFLNYTNSKQLNRHQCTYERDVEFPCGHKSQSSFYSPESAHYLRPGKYGVSVFCKDLFYTNYE